MGPVPQGLKPNKSCFPNTTITAGTSARVSRVFGKFFNVLFIHLQFFFSVKNIHVIYVRVRVHLPSDYFYFM